MGAPLRHFAIDSCWRLVGKRWSLFFVRICKLGPDVLPIIGPQFATGDSAARGSFDGYAVSSINLGAARTPVTYGGLSDTQNQSELANATYAGDGNFEWMCGG